MKGKDFQGLKTKLLLGGSVGYCPILQSCVKTYITRRPIDIKEDLILLLNIP